MSNLTGTAMSEIVLISLAIPAAAFLRCALWNAVCRRNDGRFVRPPNCFAWLSMGLTQFILRAAYLAVQRQLGVLSSR
eukprot:COSAG05_NODE_300_length_11883_cov_12.913357_3_plen_78_part_00